MGPEGSQQGTIATHRKSNLEMLMMNFIMIQTRSHLEFMMDSFLTMQIR